MSYPQVRLSSIGKTKSGATPYRGKQAEYFSSDGTPWVKTLDLNNGVITETSESVTDLAIKETSITVFPAGTLLIAMYGGFNQIGRTGLLSIAATTNQAITGLKLDDSKIIGYYALQALNHFRFLWRRYAASSRKDPNITRDDVDAFKIPLPSLPTQRRIAAILQTWDRAIQLAEQQLADLQERKRGLMQLLLTGKKRLPEFEGKEEWREVKLGDVAKRVKRKVKEVQTIPLTISGNRGFVDQSKYFSKSIASTDQSNYTLLNKGEFAYNRSYSNGYPMGAIKQLTEFENGAVTTLYIPFCMDTEIVDNTFFNATAESGFFNHGLSKIANEGGRAHGLLNVALDDFFSLKFFLPSPIEQKSISRVISLHNEELVNQKNNVSSLRLQKRGLMQRLLEGEVEVVEEMDEILGL